MAWKSDEKTSNKRQKQLHRELAEYEKKTPMTDEEREALHEWVDSGYSVYENPCMAVYPGASICGGGPVPFLDVYREEKELDARCEELRAKEGRKGELRFEAEMHHRPLEDYLVERVISDEKQIDCFAGLLKEHGLYDEAMSRLHELQEKEHEEELRMWNTELDLIRQGAVSLPPLEGDVW